MGTCIVCGNNYQRSFEVVMDNQSFTFDSFECAIQHLAPTCDHCGCRIIGHGMESGATFYCCAHCASASGVEDVRDHSRDADTART